MRSVSSVSLRRRLIGDRVFYRKVLTVVMPMIIQNGITNFVSLLDNLMVGSLGTEQMSGVAIVNQLLFVFNLCIFGGLSGAGIFTSQFYGKKDQEGVRDTFRYKALLGIFLTLAALIVFYFFGSPLISLYLTDTTDGPAIQTTLRSGEAYLRIMMLSLPAFMVVQIYTSTLRECSETMLPMKAGIIAVMVNLLFNWILIWGHLGFPALGVQGAAIATVLSRLVELGIVCIWTHRHTALCPWIEGAWRHLRVPGALARKITIKGSPLLINEALWSSAMAFLNQCYSVRGLSVVAAMNISSTFTNLFNVVFLSMGSAVSIMVGQRLGAGDMEGARDTDTKMITFSIFLASSSAVLLLLTSPLFPRLYNTSDDVRSLATRLMMVTALFMPMNAFLNATYFTLRSGGKTIITFVFDSVFAWVVSIPVVFLLTRLSSLPVPGILACEQGANIFKCILGFYLVRKGVWLHNMVAGDATKDG
ncbi:MAG: MATE family efflux transporter [Clostridia bacterium]|nr:MATE family efflux transporter [Clostridia bacterium]